MPVEEGSQPPGRVIRGGGLTFLTNDPCLIAAVRRLGELQHRVEELKIENARLQQQEVARFRTLRRDVRQIKRIVQKAAP